MYRYFIFSFFIFMIFSGCAGKGGNVGQLQSYSYASSEADWIRNGEPIEFEDELWYPQDGLEVLLDSEVQVIGEYRGIQIFIDKIDVRPFRRLYTKFGANQFRFYEKRLAHD